MTSARLTGLIGLLAAAAALPMRAYEVNFWPLFVQEKDDSGQTVSWTAAGPFLFSGPTAGPEAGTAQGLRPFFAQVTGGGSVRTDILYPVYFHRQYPGHYQWTFFELINGAGSDPEPSPVAGPVDHNLDVWPFYFSRDTGSGEGSYHALFPVAGTIRYRLGYDRLSWVIFPLFVQGEKHHTTRTYTPWPFVRVVKGEENGFELWPLFGSTAGPGPARHVFAAWPFFWDNVTLPKPNAPAGTAPGTQFGLLPLYTREAGPGYLSENYLWPFFGHTVRTQPNHYTETRYLWPFLVQGRGDDKRVDRWGPVYTHSNVKGLDSTWVLWPLWHERTWADGDIAQRKTQFFYFLFWSLNESSLSRPSAAPAYKLHVWPLVSVWDNGAGSRQVQVPSPVEVFFPDNRDVRVSWTPLFSLYQYDHKPTGETRQSLLWNAITWRRNPAGRLSEFHVGPLLGMRSTASGDSWTILGFDFGGKPDKVGGPSR